METIYDWITIIVFSGLVVLYLQRSTQPVLTDSILQYLPPAIGCALSNWLGNEGHDPLAILTLGASIAYIFLVLKPVLPKR
jgi:hypothetical protein